ncbi:hypothetical protein [Candidatus Soleaferrea massiliensis]|uniref:hypothetical protein n=1 Tax=Candidatus Soleaferrea massiliensis TaxID=1470354 RepID=UPI00058C9946|nr:hypothetical protein [Candidatus Soleaferrea massiliensis]
MSFRDRKKNVEHANRVNNDLKCYEGFSPLIENRYGSHNYALNPIEQTLESYRAKNEMPGKD